MSDFELIKCPVCGKDVSSEAKSCPNCGHPIKEKELEEEAKQIARYSQIEEFGKKKNKNKKGCSTGCVTFIICIALMGFVVNILSQNPEQFDGTANSSTSETGQQTQSQSGESMDNYDYRSMVERAIKELWPNAEFDLFMTYRTWNDGTFTMVENQFKIDDVKHKYVARCGGGKLFHLTVDGEKIYYDEEGQWEYMSNED